MNSEQLRIMKPSYKNFIQVFNSYLLSKDEMREIMLKLNSVDRKCMEAEILIAATIVQVLTNTFLQNCITYLEDKLVVFVRDELEKQHALQKFYNRLQWQKTLEYQTMKLERISKKLCEVKDDRK